MSETTFIYALKEPETGEIRYIGKSDNPKKRFQAHLLRSLGQDHRSCWIRLLLSKGTKPNLEVIDEVPYEFWESAEMGYIHFYRASGCDLVNTSRGGESGPGLSGKQSSMFGKHHSKETKDKISAARLGKYSGPNSSFFGRTHTPDAIAKMSASRIGKCCGADHPNFGKTFSSERREKSGSAMRGKNHSQETLERMSLAQRGEKNPNFGKVMSMEQRAKISAAKLGTPAWNRGKKKGQV